MGQTLWQIDEEDKLLFILDVSFGGVTADIKVAVHSFRNSRIIN